MGQSPTSTEFSVLVLITFLLKIDILGLNILFIRKSFIRKWGSKTPKPKENVTPASNALASTFKT